MSDFYPDIYDYLDHLETPKSVSVQGLEEMIYYVRAHTGLEYDVVAIIVKAFFQELRNGMLEGEIIYLSAFGKFLISSPINNKATQHVIPLIKSFTELRRKLNDSRFK